MKIILKRSAKLWNPTESNPVANRIRRKVRAHVREVKQAIVKNNGDTTCSICIDEIIDVLDTEVTACGHLFHKSCYHEYTKQRAMLDIESIHESTVYDCDQAHWEAGKAMIKVLIGHDTGFSCPNCRKRAPLIHHLAKRSVVRARAFQLGCVCLELSSNDVLDLATRH